MKRYLLLSVFVVALIACREKRITSTENNNTNRSVSAGDGASVNPKVDSTNLSRMVVSFISKGEGIDLVTKEKFDEWLSTRPEYAYTVTQKGREGEMKYCFVMRDKKPEMYSSFVMDVKNYLAGKELVLVAENEVCQHVHQIAVTDVEQAPVGAADTSVTRLVVSFISKGEGIDDKTKDEFEKWLAMRERFTYSVTPWGREGEVEYCFRMTNISVREQEIFVKEVRGFLVDKELVLVSEYSKCK